MINKNFKRGIEILSNYTSPRGASLAVGHEKIIVHTDLAPSKEHQDELYDLGWGLDSDYEDGSCRYWRAYV